jgi:hypothetical protein
VTGRHRAAELPPRVLSLREVIAAVADPPAGEGPFPDHGWRPDGSTDLGCRVLPEAVLAQLLPSSRLRPRHPDSASRPDVCGAGAADSAASRPSGFGMTGEPR